MTEVYDKDVMGSSQIRKTGGETIGKDRKQPASMTRRMKAVGGGKMEPVKSPARRKDAGQQKPKSQTQQQPTQARGSAADAQKAAAKEERRKAAQARIAARKSGKAVPTPAKKTPTASQLLTKKTTKTVSPDYKPAKASGYSRDERRKLKRAGDRLIRDTQKGIKKPASHYDPKL